MQSNHTRIRARIHIHAPAKKVKQKKTHLAQEKHKLEQRCLADAVENQRLCVVLFEQRHGFVCVYPCPPCMVIFHVSHNCLDLCPVVFHRPNKCQVCIVCHAVRRLCGLASSRRLKNIPVCQVCLTFGYELCSSSVGFHDAPLNRLLFCLHAA